MGCLDDVARFRPEDPPAVIAASFACPLCLWVDCEGVLTPAAHDSQVACRCVHCDARWGLGVDAAQVLRLALAAPGAGPGYQVALRIVGRRDAPWAR